MNLAVLRKTRRAPEAGDVFVMQPPDGEFLFGRVISTEAEVGPMKGCVLIYVYRSRSRQKTPVPELLREDLLVPPVMTNKLPWTRGYFEHVENRPLALTDCLAEHCFERSWTSPAQYYDDRGHRLSGPIPPVGEYGLQSYRTIDDKISKALGIPLAPDD